MSAHPMKMATGYSQAAADPGLPLDVLATNVQEKASVAGGTARDAVWTIIVKAAEARERDDETAARALLEAALTLLEEIFRWRDAFETEQITAARATAAAESCPAHGDEIRNLRHEIFTLTVQRDRIDGARKIAVAWLVECVKFAENARGRRGVVGLPPPLTIIEWMERQLPKVRRAHDLTLNPPAPAHRRTRDHH